MFPVAGKLPRRTKTPISLNGSRLIKRCANAAFKLAALCVAAAEVADTDPVGTVATVTVEGGN